MANWLGTRQTNEAVYAHAICRVTTSSSTTTGGLRVVGYVAEE